MKKVPTLLTTALAAVLLAVPGIPQEKAAQKKIPDYSQTARKDVPVDFTWKIEDLYATIDAWKADKDAVAKMMTQAEALSKGWTSSPQNMLALLEFRNELGKKAEKLFSYTSNQINADLGNTTYQSLGGELQSLFVTYNSKMAFFEPDVLALGSEKFSAYLKAEPKLAPYGFPVEDILRGKEHVLPAEQQRIASLTGLFSGATGQASGMLNDLNMPAPEVTLSDGQKTTLNFATFAILRRLENAEDRHLVVTSFWGNQKKYENTFAVLQDGAIKQHLFNAQIHNFKNCLEARLFDNNIPVDVYQQLIRSTRENLTPFQRYLSLKQKLLGLPHYRYEDIYASAVPAVQRTYTYEEARQICMDALKPLGDEYAQSLKQAFENRWIDIYPNKGKESGAYSGGVYGVHPYIKLNFDGKYDGVSTMAHELGHALHSELTNKTQHYATTGYAAFLAEIASTFNENLVMNYLLKNEKDDLFKLYVIDNYLDQVRGTLYRQVLFSEFELAIHQRVEEGQTLTPDWLDQKYLELTRHYYGHDKGVCEVGDYIQCEWSRVSHFYLNYYVFQYSTGLIASMALSDMVLSQGPEAQRRYLDLLKSGSSDYPMVLLKKAGVDMTTPVPYEAAFKRIDQLVTEMETIVERLKAQGKLKI